MTTNPDVINQKVLEVTQHLEEQVDAAIERIDNLDLGDLEQLRKQRMQEIKSKQNKRQECLRKGHGSYEQLTEEKMFFDAVKKSDNVVIHFFTPSNSRSPIVDKHLKILAPKHVETKFVSLNIEKCQFLAERLKIRIIPTLVCVHNEIMVDKIVGFTTLGNRDDFSTEVLEWRLAQSKVIEYEGDLSVPPDNQVQDKKEFQKKSSIRNGIYDNESDDDLELEDHSEKFEAGLLLTDSLNGTKRYDPNDLTPEEKLQLGISDEDQE